MFDDNLNQTVQQEPAENLRGIRYKKNGKHWLINDYVKIHNKFLDNKNTSEVVKERNKLKYA